MARELTYQEYVNVMKSGRLHPMLKIEMVRPDGSVYGSFTKYPLTGSSLTADASKNGTRRSVNLVLDNTDGFFIPDPNNGHMWLNTMFILYVGVLDDNDNYKYFPQGCYTISNSQVEIDSSPSDGYKVNLRADDKFEILNANGLEAPYEIPIGNKATDVIRSILTQNGDLIPPNLQKLDSDTSPYRMRFDVSQNNGDIVTDMANLYSRECFYDNVGRLTFREFQDVSTLEVIWNFSTNELTYMGANRTMLNDKVFNRIIVKATNSDSNVTYTGEATNTDPASPTRIGFIPTKTYAITDDKIWSDDLAQQRADMELANRMRVQESIAVQCLAMPHFDVNKAFTLADSALGLTRGRYAIQQMQMPLDLSSNMSLTAYKYNNDDTFSDRTSMTSTDGTDTSS